MKFCVALVLLLFCLSCNERHKTDISVAFYNVENLFDTNDDPKKFDEQYLPNSDRKWTKARYEKKLINLAKVIRQINNEKAPDFLGVCEIENSKVIQDLIAQPSLSDRNYQIVHRESPDERGIDVGFIYNSKVFSVDKVETHQPDLSKYDDKTRDILRVSGKLPSGEELHFLINHWPSRGEGRKESEPKRIIAAKNLKNIIYSILEQDEEAKIIVMGDFNDEPSNRSISETLGVSCNESETLENQLYNPFCELENRDLGSYRYRSYWDMLDQIMVSSSLLDTSHSLYLNSNSAEIIAEPWMIQTGKYEGFPLRSYGGYKYLGGYSDHFPVSLSLRVR